ncbi:MAG TPA: pyrroloquinoline quinone-dependent dehydrogenase [Gemmatimonadaceae bacterium]|nr:pyrroloquinoline quinone-dependent dehydrogenase [Gemmatimonadaceae bacterium]
MVTLTLVLTPAPISHGLAAQSATPRTADWPTYGGDPGGSRYSPLKQIDTNNVARLEIAWVYHTGDVSDGTEGRRKTEFETTPIVVDGTMYLSTAFNRVIALDPETGKEKWSFDPKIDLRVSYSEGLMNRGVSLWTDADRTGPGPCRTRLFIGTIDARLFSLDAATGQPCGDFGTGGYVDLRGGIRNIKRPGEYEETSAPAVIDGLVVVGSSIADNDRVDSPSGVVRAFDARTGALRWSWKPISDSIAPTGAGNAWGTISVDPERHLVFVPTGSASPDYHGFKRPGANRWANSVVALRASSGRMVWGFQLVHHDLWDYDNAAQPVLATLRKGGETIPVVIQGNKSGFLYVLNRETGKPVFGVEERRVPASDADGEDASPTQPFPLAPPPLVPQRLTPDSAWGPTPDDRAACRARMEHLRSEGVFTPPSAGGTIAYPGNLGGMNWSSGAFDPQRQIFVTNVNNLPMEVHLIPRDQYQQLEDSARAGQFRAEVSPQRGTPYGMSREVLRSPSGLPCNPPPWGSLVAVNLADGSIRWSVPLGTTADLPFAGGVAVDGTPSLGGPIITAGGLVFIASAMDNYLRAFDVESGRELWKGRLPAGGQALPMTYRLRNGKQYVVVAAGGHGKIGTTLGDAVVAFALP